ncbi:MAG: methyltransferase domain-containing protein [Gemmatimonadota bacterium]|nr:methyltransferase domain-containing protein [Gemmatimonadota bacterium]
MDARLQRRVQRYGWDRAANDYEIGWRRQLEPAQRLSLDLAGLAPGEDVLDVACGTGLLSIPAARAVAPGGTVLGTDISRRMVDRAAARAAEEGVGNARFARSDAESLEAPDGAFDAALCALGLMYVPDAGRALEEMLRVLRPGGRAVVAVWGARASCGWSGIFHVVDERVSTEVCPMFFRLGTGETLARSMEAAGFTDVESRRIETRLEYDSNESALRAAFAGGPVAMAYSRFDDATRADAHAAYLETIAPYRTPAGYDMPGEFVVVRGRRPG